MPAEDDLTMALPDGLVIDIAIAKTAKYASGESGDTADVAERPLGGFSVVMIDGQGSGDGAKALSSLLTNRAVSMIKEGVRDGVVVRGLHDILFAMRGGRVSATLDLVTADLKTGSLIVTRNASTPLLVDCGTGEWTQSPLVNEPLGRYLHARPVMAQWGLAAGMRVVTVTDGIAGAGLRHGLDVFDLLGYAVESLPAEHSAAHLADRILDEAMARDRQRPQDDMAVTALCIRAATTESRIRRVHVEAPLG